MNRGIGLATLREWGHKLVAPIDGPLMLIAGLLLLMAIGMMGSASPERLNSQLMNVAAALVVMRFVAQVPPQRLMHLAVPVYVFGVLLLIAVALFGDVSKGARRWLNLGVMRIQPLPHTPPEPTAIVDWMMWKPLPSGSALGSSSISTRWRW